MCIRDSPLSDIRLPGVHNIENYMAAIAAVDGLVPDKCVRAVAQRFTGVEHRIELVREVEGVKYYNDAIGTSPTPVSYTHLPVSAGAAAQALRDEIRGHT